jgi:hypothetical protein
VEWNDINKTKSWVNYFALSLSNPKPIISFARNNNLLDKMPFCHLTQYCRSNTAVDIARVLKVSTSPAGIKYKFGIQVPKGIKNAIDLDKKNGNQLWQEVIKRELKIRSHCYAYGSELVASRVATELILETRYMLRSLGVALDGPSSILGDNVSVVLNTTVPSNVLKKKHHAIVYHRVREAIAARIMRFAYIKSEENVSDVLKKPLSNDTFHYLMKRWLLCVTEKDK